MPWIARAVWVALAVAGGEALDAATAARSAAVSTTATVGGIVLWVAGVAALAVPSVAGVTAARVVVPASVPASVVAWVAGGGVPAAIATGIGILASIVVLSAEFGRAGVQASAYGDEDRHPLRPPPAYALAAVVSWGCTVAAAIAGPLLLAAGNWIVGVPVAAAAVALGVFSWPRWHRLTRRWLVLVPAGVVVHDHLVLAETLMLRRQEVAGIRLAPAGTEAADLTGPAGGHAVEILAAEPVTAIFAGTPRVPRGTVIHLTACLVAPTRPGRALAAAGRRRLPVG